MRREELAAKVKAVNAANKYANELYDLLAPFFGSYVGCKILKIDSSLLESVKKVLPSFKEEKRIRTYRNSSAYTLGWTVNVSENYETNGGTCATYYEITVYIAELDGPNLRKIMDRYNRRTDYTLEAILATQAATKKAKEVYEKLRSECQPFGE